jgi:amino acid permease
MIPSQIATWANAPAGSFLRGPVFMGLVTGAIMLFIVFPLSALKRIEFLSFTSFLAIVGILYMIFVIFYKFVEKMVVGGLPTKDIIWVSSDILSILNSLPTLVFAYGSHITLLPMYQELKNRSPRKMSGVMNFSVLCCLLFYAFVGLCGYIQFANVVPFSDAILDLYARNDIVVTIARMFIAAVVIFSYPLVHYACRASIENIFFSRFQFNWIRWFAITFFICLTTTILGVFVRQMSLCLD